MSDREKRLQELFEERKTLAAKKNEVLAPIQSREQELIQEEAAILKAIREDRARVLLSQVPALLLLVPQHRKTSCSDEKPYNQADGCLRCALVTAQSCGYWDADYDLDIVLENVR